ncbi:aminodeoxychorismate lyase [[Candida] jaroonii]|uniref:Aminodeoxychorismate lyase n=1 Tax=[Candida] jaroonii TaxID=467808 RepID=A0ACA9YBJ6_9ASCO|nr:aminodeoxychorismate lyase [[Candida] jaroonii]
MSNTKSKSKTNWLSEDEQQLLAQKLYDNYIRCTDEEQDFQILSTIRYDPKLSASVPETVDEISESNFFLLPEHYHRLQYSFEFFTQGQLDMSKELMVTKLIGLIRDSKVEVTKPYRIRFLTGLKGEINMEIYDTVERKLLDGLEDNLDKYIVGLDDDIWDVYVDSEPTLISPFTSFKTTHRPHYTKSRQNHLPGVKTQEEVLIWNTQQTLMEGSITNFAIKLDGKWVTPELACGCLCGVMRHFLLKNDYISESTIHRSEILVGDEILLFNGIMGVVRGKIKSIPDI